MTTQRLFSFKSYIGIKSFCIYRDFLWEVQYFTLWSTEHWTVKFTISACTETSMSPSIQNKHQTSKGNVSVSMLVTRFSANPIFAPKGAKHDLMLAWHALGIQGPCIITIPIFHFHNVIRVIRAIPWVHVLGDSKFPCCVFHVFHFGFVLKHKLTNTNTKA